MVSPEEVTVAERIIRAHVLRQYDTQATPGEDWRDLPEVPNKSEIFSKEDEDERNDFFIEKWDDYQNEPRYERNLPENVVKGPWPSKEAYIAAHYQILREDATASLRNSVKSVKFQPHMDDDNYTHVYTDVHIIGMILSSQGPAFRVEFSHHRAGKQIRWKQSSRLQQGTMVALSPMTDSFRTKCKIAIVAARPFEGGLDQNPPQIDLFWGDIGETAFDPVESYVMVESRAGYFEASRHMLVALQKLRTEQFRLSKHLVELDQDIGAPDWLEEQTFLNLTSLIRRDIVPTKEIPAEEEVVLCNANVLQGFPKIPSSGMDESQLRACERMITKKVSIVQGPPGTGKTFTSVSALRVLIENMEHDSPPIIISAQTNHALDQLMNHIMAFEPNVLRLGGRSDKENIEILKRTLYVLRSTTNDVPNSYRGIKSAKVTVENKQKEIQETMAPLCTGSILSEEALFRAGIITEAQKNSLSDNDAGWASNNTLANPLGRLSPLHQWVYEKLVPIPKAPLVNFGLPIEESDLEYEQLQQVDQENEEGPADKVLDSLTGVAIVFSRAVTGHSPVGADDKKIRKLLSSKQDLHDIPTGMRGQVYRYFEKQLNKTILAKLKEQLREYKSATDALHIAKWTCNFRLIKHLGIKVIGCTTTGLAKYRGLLAALQPRILLIEEAAETLEGTIMAGMLESLEQLILVGDHKQLQANANVRALEAAPYHLSTSMFERLIENSIGFTMLNQQRRMISDVRKLLCIEPDPFYENLHDHPSVLDRNTNRLPIPGMGGKDTYFFHHNWPEMKTSDMSQCNPDEAEMITEFFNYLVLNGTPCSKITVLTFYNGQRKTILQGLKRHSNLGDYTYFNVFTVDSYQGEENDVILLSLVRSNDKASIGFLDSKNRLVVALSRARRGLYIFGNSITLTTQEFSYGEDRESIIRDPMWQSIIGQMRATARYDLEGGLPITCSNHGKTIRVYNAAEWIGLAGGCHQRCTATLSCGHRCRYFCHPFDHSRIVCEITCTKILSCSHGCSGKCGDDCFCLEPECQKLFGLSLASATTWDSPSGKNARSQTPQARTAALSVSPKKGAFASQDIRKSGEKVRRELSGSNPKRKSCAGNGFQKTGITSKQRNALSPSKAFLSDRSSVNPWNLWDPQKADKEASDERQRRAALAHEVDLSTIVYKDTWRAVKIENGIRQMDPESSSTTIIARFDKSSQALLQAKSGQAKAQTPLKSAVADLKTLSKGSSENNLFVLPVGLPRQVSKDLSKPLPQLPKKQASNPQPHDLYQHHGTSDPKSKKSAATKPNLSSGWNELTASTFADLVDLEIGPDLFGTAEDLDEFEKCFG